MFSLIAPLASLLGIEVEALKERLLRQGMVWTIVGAFGLIAIVFLLVAINSALTLSFGPVVAPLILCGAALFIALAVYLVWHILEGIAARREAEKKRNTETAALITTAALAAIPVLLKSPLLKQIGIPAGGALAAAYLLSRPRRSQPDD